ncbi:MULTISPECIES: zf-HC2 domain-containing protein [Actinoalloteichus]|uniref:Integral membrane protein n=1 Tax=Actinoalloteichus fjordicus TaxID=1612552 RepID=A0AAC9LD43_9PSEU|nr:MULTISPECIES: zf-HC2 domain-containing protein [Actinoalloteichus]APU14664.1 putative integral membrane protein [Actinoalloteichus fjordicus]APU20632.1 putative integral membrane protein [Actinoalloteichus sp. GBA129-24]
MECDTCREALSARLDSEAEPVRADETDEHLRTCVECRSWQQRATLLTRSMRVRAAVAPPDLTDAILAARGRGRGEKAVRAALASVGVAQLALGAAQLLGVDHGMTHDGAAATHLFNESTAWSLAMGLGLLWAALRSGHSRGMLPLVGGFVLVLSVFSVQDLIAGEVTVSRVLSHGLLVIGLGLLTVVHRQESRHSPEPGRPGIREPRQAAAPLPAEIRLQAPDLPRSGRRRLRSITGRRAA